MAKKKPANNFRNTPFKDLKGVSVSQPLEPSKNTAQEIAPELPAAEEDFFSRMAQLGVRPLDDTRGAAGPEPVTLPVHDSQVDHSSDQELFLAELESLDGRCADDAPEPPSPTTQPRRMKQLQRGKLQIEASLDLHGLTRREALEKTEHFLDNAAFHQLQTLLIVTGKGGHSNDGPVLRSAIEAYLQANSHRAVIEWDRAPREHGGEGALVVFLHRSGL